MKVRTDFHSLRHTCGAWLAITGVHPKVVQQVMGHQSFTLTMDTYGHLFPGQEADALRRMRLMLVDPPEALRATGWGANGKAKATPARTVSVWLAIDDVDSENACMQFVTGSYQIGTVPHRVSRADEKNVLRVSVDGVETHGKIVDVVLRAGQISLHADMLLHGSGANTSNRRRCGLTIRYVDANVLDLRDWSDYGVLIYGEDRRGQWGNPPRPVRD